MSASPGKIVTWRGPRWRFRMFSALVAGALLVTAPASLSPQTPQTPFRYQHGSAWCWAAAGQMIMEQAGSAGDYSQATQAEQVVPGCLSSPRNTCMNVNAVYAGCNRPFFPTFDDFGFAYEDSTSHLEWEQLKRELDNHRPVLFGWCVPKHCGDTTQNSMGHWLVAVEADVCSQIPTATPMIKVYDPAPCCKGKVRSMTFETYANGEGGLRFWRNYYHVRPASQAPPEISPAASPALPRNPLEVARRALTTCLPNAAQWAKSGLLLNQATPPSGPDEIREAGLVRRRYIPLASIGAIQTPATAEKAAGEPMLVLATQKAGDQPLVSVVFATSLATASAFDDSESARGQRARIKKANEVYGAPQPSWDEYVIVETGLHFILVPDKSRPDLYEWAVAIPSEIDCRKPKDDEQAEAMKIEELIERVTVSH